MDVFQNKLCVATARGKDGRRISNHLEMINAKNYAGFIIVFVNSRSNFNGKPQTFRCTCLMIMILNIILISVGHKYYIFYKDSQVSREISLNKFSYFGY